MYDFVLQFGFDKETEKYIQNIKNTLKDHEVLDKEKCWRPHITIDLYDCSDEKLFVNMVDEIVEEIESFDIEFYNLNNFDEETLYIEPHNKEKLCEIKRLFDDRLNDFRLKKRIGRVYRPHVTLCTNDDLTEAKIISEAMFKPFKGKVSYLWIYNPRVELIKEYHLNYIIKE